MNQKELQAQLKKDNIKVEGDEAKKMAEDITNGNDKQFLGVGVHEVKIVEMELTKADTGTLGIKFDVENEEGQNMVSMWLSPKALPYTIRNISRLIIHNTPEDKKEKAKEFLAKIDSAEKIYEVACEKLMGAKAFLQVKESETRTYTNAHGETKASLDRSLLSYKPVEKKTDVQKVAEVMASDDELDLGDIPF